MLAEPHKTLGDALIALGYRRTVWIGGNIGQRVTGDFNPTAPLLDFEARYGKGSAKRKGDLVGERYAKFIVESVIQHPMNRLGIKNNLTYTLRDGEEYDVKMVAGSNGLAIYDWLFRPAYRALFPEEQQPKPPAPKPSEPTKPAPTPVPPRTTPEPPPAPPTTPIVPLDTRTNEIRQMVFDAVPRGSVPTWVTHLAESPLVVLAIARAIEIYRKIMAASR